MLYITHWTSSSSSLLSGFIKIFTCFQNETKVHRRLLGRRGGIGCIQLPFGWRCHTKSSHTEHGWIVKIFHPERRSLLHRKSPTPPAFTRHGYITFSKSCKDRMILSSWKQWEDIFITLTSTTRNFAQHRRGSAAATAGNGLAFITLFILDELELIQWSGPDSAKQLSLTLAP